MFRLPNLPSPRAEVHELADFAELLAWGHGSASAQEIVGYLRQAGDNDDNGGCDDDEDSYSNELDEVMNELARRTTACGAGYPFTLIHNGTALQYTPDDGDHRTLLYCYLLLCTRLNMQNSRVHNGTDGAALFEEISAHVLRCYLGYKRARSKVFGTSAPGGFKAKINKLCKHLREGGKFRHLDSGNVAANDDRLDAVAWVPFSDRNQSQLIIFGQCKTGTSWGTETTQLQPQTFTDRWMSEPFMVKPMRAFCIAESANRARWKGDSLYAGLLFDRCRLMDFCEKLKPGLLNRVRNWTAAAHATVPL